MTDKEIAALLKCGRPVLMRDGRMIYPERPSSAVGPIKRALNRLSKSLKLRNLPERA